jgi:hypothetical protein
MVSVSFSKNASQTSRFAFRRRVFVILLLLILYLDFTQSTESIHVTSADVKVIFNPKISLASASTLCVKIAWKVSLHSMQGHFSEPQSTDKLEHWYVRHNDVYCLHPWATYFNLYTGHLQALLYMWVHKKLCTVGSHRVSKFKAY